MRKFILIAAVAAVSATSAQAGDSRSLSLAGVDEKIPAALGKAADVPKIVEAPKPPDPPKSPDAPKAAETAKPAEEPKADQPPNYVARPAAIGTKPDAGKGGQVTFEDNKPVVEKEKPAAVEQERRTARADKPRRQRGHAYWSEARIMRELARYGIYW
ncbi:MAG TPA: hypothetical protein VJS63_04905 [Bradyrhizobium sp.]|nr:hypothetical protein [Bradyrhizobium sp.]